jgi:hypothetical protein
MYTFQLFEKILMVQNFLRGILIEHIIKIKQHCEENKNLPKFSKSRRIKETGSVLNVKDGWRRNERFSTPLFPEI